MTKRQIVLVFGIIIFLVPFLGLSESLKYYIVSLLGLGLIIFAFTLKRNSLSVGSTGTSETVSNKQTFVESNHINPENK
jgi:VIT1/CCC1 family predicted Fe2+/Mn2+ transporter